MVLEAIGKVGLEAGKDVFIAPTSRRANWAKAADALRLQEIRAGTHVRPDGRPLRRLIRQHPIISIEDGLAEGDREGWQLITKTLGDYKVQLVGDDVFVTNPRFEARHRGEGGQRPAREAQSDWHCHRDADAVAMARDAGYATIMSHRSGETEDRTIADLASARRPDRSRPARPAAPTAPASTNQLLRIEEELDQQRSTPARRNRRWQDDKNGVERATAQEPGEHRVPATRAFANLQSEIFNLKSRGLPCWCWRHGEST